MSCERWFGLGLSGLLLGSHGGCTLRHTVDSPHTATAQTRAVAVAFQHEPFIRWVKDSTDAARMSVVVGGLNPEMLRELRAAAPDHSQWSEIFAVYAEQPGQAGTSDLPPIQGRYAILENRIQFEPQFPMQPGVNYRAEVRTGKIPGLEPKTSRTVTSWYRMTQTVLIPKTVVRRVFPTTSRLPENLLKFYLQFSGPMRRGGIYEHIHLIDASGRPVELPFLEIEEELWNPEMTRLTLFIDPGRIKRGVTPLEEIGPSMEAGKSYTLVIDAKWRDTDGAQLKSKFRKAFTVDPPDRDPPNTTTWKIKPPKAGSREPLVIRFAEPMDHALAHRLIWVLGPDQARLPGEITLADQEKLWSFTPSAPWKAGRHSISADTMLEDLAGNSLGRPFEVDVFEHVEAKTSKHVITVPFEVGDR